MGGKCGKLREACLSETDKRYDSNADFGLAVQSDFWERTSVRQWMKVKCRHHNVFSIRNTNGNCSNFESGNEGLLQG